MNNRIRTADNMRRKGVQNSLRDVVYRAAYIYKDVHRIALKIAPENMTLQDWFSQLFREGLSLINTDERLPKSRDIIACALDADAFDLSMRTFNQSFGSYQRWRSHVINLALKERTK